MIFHFYDVNRQTTAKGCVQSLPDALRASRARRHYLCNFRRKKNKKTKKKKTEEHDIQLCSLSGDRQDDYV